MPLLSPLRPFLWDLSTQFYKCKLKIGFNPCDTYKQYMSPTTAITFIALLAILRLYMILPSKKKHSRTPRSSVHVCTIAVFLGSGTYFTLAIHPWPRHRIIIGGHTSEALTLVSALDFRRYNRRIYIVSEGDDLSEQKAISLEMSKGPPQKESVRLSHQLQLDCHCI